ncbi:MAG TPA: VTT domain-containing protein [Bryobacteraceae bacterium]|jgi:membrane protein DedA with SNARE-associated domain|nr:VTT domain-containing protein [Bryobacteraceae bacterium]
MKGFLQLLISWGPLGVFALAFIESIGIPNPGGTDALLLFVAIKRPDTAILCAVLATAGSLLGSAVFYEIVSKGGDKFLLRYTLSGRGKRFRAWAQRYGMVTVFISALLPLFFLPLKVFSACACAMGVSRTRYMLVMAAARIPRYAGLAYLGAQLGENSTAWIKGHTWHMAAFAVALFGILYALLKWNDRTRGYNEGTTIEL